MAFAPGDSLDVALKQFGPAVLADLAPRLRILARTLDGAAAQGVFHGALHPRDILVSEHSTLLTGLGVWPILARFGERIPVRRPYRAPELADTAATAAGDAFAFAALAYEWMSGRRPPSAFVAGDMAAIPGTNRDALALVFARALHADPAMRFPSCDDFVDEIVKAGTEEATAQTDPEAVRGRSEGKSRRKAARAAQPSPTLPLDTFPTEAPPRTESPSPAEAPLRVDVPLQVPAPAIEDAPLHAAPSRDVEAPLHELPRTDQTEESDGSEPAPLATEPPDAVDDLRTVTPPPVVEREPHEPGVNTRRGTPVASAADAPVREPALPPMFQQTPPAPSGTGRMFIGLVLGLLLGVGAGYLVWGRAATPATSADAIPPPGAAPPAVTDQPVAAPQSQSPPATAAAPAAGTAPGTTAVSPPPAAAPPAPAPVEKADTSGNLLVRSTPAGATVLVDGERRGVTPLTLQKVSLGTRRVRLQRDGYEAEDRQVTLTASRPSRSLDVRLTRAAPAAKAASAAPPASTARTGSLVVESRPIGAAVTLNGKAVGTTPLTIEDLPPGEYTVRLQLAAHRPVTTYVRVVAGQRARAAASLESAQEPQ
jgi:hypothetical protein